jgi:thiosulfate dehydrogenase [quinone] large subunit
MRHPAAWLALLRVVVGAWFLKAAWTKLAWSSLGGVPLPTVSPRFLGVHARRVAEFAADNPLPWYRDFLEATVLPHATLFATLQVIGEVVVGVGLVLGLLTVVSAVVGLYLSLAFGLATHWMSPGQLGFHVILIAAMLAFVGARAGRVGGLDRWLRPAARRHRWLELVL